MTPQIIFIGGIGSNIQFGGELTKNKEILNRLEELGYNVACIDTYGANHSKRKLLKVISQIFCAVFRNPKTPIIFSTSFNNIYPILKVFHRLGIRRTIIYWVIGGIFGERVRDKEFNPAVLKQIKTFLVEGRLMQAQLKDAGFENSIYVPNFKTLHNIHHKSTPSNSICRFVFLSRIMPQKGCDEIFESATKLNNLGYRDRFYIDFYGAVDGEYEANFQEQLNQHTNINYRGKIDLTIEDNYQQLADYDFMLFPTHWRGEGFPGVVIDAYKSSLPIIGSDWNFNQEFIIDRQTGILVKPCDIEDLITVMKNAIDGQYRNLNLSKNAANQAERYDTKNVVTEDLMNKILND